MRSMIVQTVNLERYVRLRIEQARLLAGYSKAEMAKRLNISPPGYLDIENGKRRLDLAIIQRIADLTEHDLGFFLPTVKGSADIAAAILAKHPGLSVPALNQLLQMIDLLAEQDRQAQLRGPGNGGRDAASPADSQDNSAA